MNHGFTRNERVAGLLRRELATLIWSEVKDPRLGSVNLTDVEVTRDLSHAKVYITSSDAENIKDSLTALNHAAGFLRSRLGQMVRMRAVPELKFFYDASLEQGDRIEALLAESGVKDSVDEQE